MCAFCHHISHIFFEDAQRQSKRRSAWSDCSGKNGEAIPEQVRSVGRPSEPQANGLTALLGATIIMYNFLYIMRQPLWTL